MIRSKGLERDDRGYWVMRNRSGLLWTTHFYSLAELSMFPHSKPVAGPFSTQETAASVERAINKHDKGVPPVERKVMSEDGKGYWVMRANTGIVWCTRHASTREGLDKLKSTPLCGPYNTLRDAETVCLTVARNEAIRTSSEIKGSLPAAPQISGYRSLSKEEIESINNVKDAGNAVGALVNSLRKKGVDPRWLAIAETHLQQGFMALTRSIAKPEGF